MKSLKVFLSLQKVWKAVVYIRIMQASTMHVNFESLFLRDKKHTKRMFVQKKIKQNDGDLNKSDGNSMMKKKIVSFYISMQLHETQPAYCSL